MAHDDLDTLLDAVDLEVDAEDVKLDREQLRLIKWIARLVRRQGETLMAMIDDIQALVAQTGADAQAAADRVLAALAAGQAAAAAQIADLQTQIQVLIDGNAADITPEQLQAVSDGLTAVDATVKGIAPEATPAP